MNDAIIEQLELMRQDIAEIGAEIRLRLGAMNRIISNTAPDQSGRDHNRAATVWPEHLRLSLA